MAKFVVYEKVAEAVYRVMPKKDMSSGMQTTVNLGSGLVAGLAAAVVSQPADTMLSKINKTKGLPGEGTTSRLIKIGKELGIRGSYSGIGARLFMVGTLTAFQFAIYGDVKKALGGMYLPDCSYPHVPPPSNHLFFPVPPDLSYPPLRPLLVSLLYDTQ
jgi:solute carrier family 25 (mitochondrial phosphate transporter), member 3